MYAIATPRYPIDYIFRNLGQKTILNWDELKKLFPNIYLHSGRTDQNGGHHDWLNRTGWGFGSYHYHHKLPAHLHPNGKCPYENKKACSIINPYTGKEVNIGIPYIFEDNHYCSLNSVIKSLTANDEQNMVLTTDNTGGLFYICSNGDSTMENLGTVILFYYPYFHEFLDNTVFETLNGDIQLLATSDGNSTEAYISLETVQNYMTKDGYFTDLSDNGSGVWSFKVRKPIVESITIIKQGEPVNSNVFNVGDEIEVQADIKYVASARMVVGKQYPMGYIDGFEERRYGLENQSTVTFSKFKLTEDVVGSTAIESGSLSISVYGHTGGTAIDAEIDARTLTDAVNIQIGSSEKPCDKIYISKEQLEQLEWKNTAEQMANELNVTLAKYDISTPERMRHFISQAMQESGLGIYTREIASGEAYEGREDLGNTQPGDGPKYKGAGYIQMTGRSNYQAFSDYMDDPNIMEGVDYVAERYPWEASGFWWYLNGMNAIVDSLEDASIDQKTLEISKAVNLGNRYSTGTPNHYENRRAYYVLTLEVIK